MSFLSDVLRQAGIARRAIRQAIDAEGGDRKIKTKEEKEEVLRLYGPRPAAKRRLDFDEEPAVRPQADPVPPKRKPRKEEEDDPEWNEEEEEEEPDRPAAAPVPPLELIKTLCLVHLTLPKPTATATRVREKLQKLVEEHLLGEGPAQEADRIVSVSGRIRKFYPDMALISEDKLRQVGMLAQEFHRQEYGMPPTKVDKGDGFMVNGYTAETAPSTLDRAIVQIFGK